MPQDAKESEQGASNELPPSSYKAKLQNHSSISGKAPKPPKIAVSRFGNDPSNHHSPKDLGDAHTNSDLHRVIAYKWSYVEHRKVRRGE